MHLSALQVFVLFFVVAFGAVGVHLFRKGQKLQREREEEKLARDSAHTKMFEFFAEFAAECGVLGMPFLFMEDDGWLTGETVETASGGKLSLLELGRGSGKMELSARLFRLEEADTQDQHHARRQVIVRIEQCLGVNEETDSFSLFKARFDLVESGGQKPAEIAREYLDLLHSAHQLWRSVKMLPVVDNLEQARQMYDATVAGELYFVDRIANGLLGSDDQPDSEEVVAEKVL